MLSDASCEILLPCVKLISTAFISQAKHCFALCDADLMDYAAQAAISVSGLSSA
jgi:hypothetical protein